MQKLPRVEMAALVAMISLGTSGMASASASENQGDSLQATEHQLLAKGGKESACGEGSCGTDKKGMKAAKDKKAAKEKAGAGKTGSEKDATSKSSGANASDAGGTK